jgi:hypothetical protein
MLLELEDYRPEHIALFVMRVPVSLHVVLVGVSESKGLGRGGGS